MARTEQAECSRGRGIEPAYNFHNATNRALFMKYSTILCLVVSLAATQPLLRAAEKPAPSGLYDLIFGAGGLPADLTGNPLLTDPNIDGFRMHVVWKALQPDNESSYNWKQIDNAVAIAAQYGKKLSVSVAAGLATPDWVYDTAPLVYRYHMIETDPATGTSVGDQPLPWDTAYQAKWANFVAAFGARYDGNPALSYVLLGGFMESCPMNFVINPDDDTAVNALAQNPPAGYPGLTRAYTDSSAAYVPAAESIIANFLKAFPTTPVILTFGNPFPTDIGVTDQQTIRNWGKAQYPGHFGNLDSALYATPAPHQAPQTVLPGPKGFQMVCRSSDPTRLYLAPVPNPIPAAPTPLQDALERAVTLNAQWVEVYQDDLVPAGWQQMLAGERQKLEANVPGLDMPKAPQNLRIVP
jgi:hypothetical protein